MAICVVRRNQADAAKRQRRDRGRRWLESLEARTLMSALPAPVVTSPGSMTSPGPVLSTLMPTFQWNAVTGVAGMTGYQLNLFDGTLGKFTAFKISATATSFTVPSSLPAGDAFVWNLRVVAGTESGAPSAYEFFRTAPPAPLPAPVIIGPGSSTSPGPVLTTLTPTLQWNAVTGVSGMTGYQVNMYDGTAAKFTSFRVSAGTTSVTVPAGIVRYGDVFVWNVRIVVGDRTGPESGYLFFQGPPAPVIPAPVATSPGDATSPGPVISTYTPALMWNAVTGVAGMTGYQLNLYDGTAGKFSTFRVGADATSFTVPALAAGHMFVWNVRVVAGSVEGPPSNYEFFQTAAPASLPAPVIIGPGSATGPGPVLTTLTPTLTWNAVTGVAGMTGYQLNLYDGTKAKFTSYHVDASATGFTLPTGAIVNGDVYVWNLRIVVGTVTGHESNYLYFQGPAAPVVPAPVILGPGNTTSPGPMLTTLTPTFTWNAVTGAGGMTGYQLNLYDGTAKKFMSFRVGADATSFTLPAGVLVAGDAYVWNLRTVLGSVTGPESQYFYFTAPV